MLFLIFLISLASPSFSHMNFKGHRLYSLFISNEEGLELVNKQIEKNEIDLWTAPVILYEKIDVRVPPSITEQMEKQWNAKGIPFHVTSYNIQKWIDKERRANPPDDASAGRQPDFKLNVYHTYDAISSYIDTIGNLYSTIASVQNIGTTYEGNAVKGLKIGSQGFNKPALWINSGIHAREWVAPAASLFIIDRLVKGYETHAKIREFVDTFDWYIFPVINVDGYKYSWTTNRLWRKNRDINRNSSCVGVDINRNFGTASGAPVPKGDPCSETYPGDTAFSEGEIRAIRDGVLGVGSRLKAYFTLVSYSQWWIPYRHSQNDTAEDEDQLAALQVALTAIFRVHGKRYKQTILSNLTMSSSADWASKKANVKYSFEIKLRDTGKRGFILCNSQIVPTAEENFAGIKAVANIIKNEEY